MYCHPQQITVSLVGFLRHNTCRNRIQNKIKQNFADTEGTEDRCHAAQLCDIFFCLVGFFALMLSASSKRELNIIYKKNVLTEATCF